MLRISERDENGSSNPNALPEASGNVFSRNLQAQQLQQIPQQEHQPEQEQPAHASNAQPLEPLTSRPSRPLEPAASYEHALSARTGASVEKGSSELGRETGQQQQGQQHGQHGQQQGQQQGPVQRRRRLDKRREEQEELAEEEDNRSWLVSFACTRIQVPQHVWDTLPPKTPAKGEEQPAKMRRSIYGLPVIPPYHHISIAWMTFMLAFDIVYTAFWVPLSIAFCLEDFGLTLADGCSQGNFFGGLVYAVNIFISFQLGAVLEYDYQDYEVTDGIILAWCYVRHGRFAIDVIATIPFVLLVVLLIVQTNTRHVAVVAVLSLLRLFRLVRLVSISKVVYISARRGKSEEGNPMKLSVTTTYIILLVYLLAVVLNLEACIMLMIATIEGLDNSWMTSLTWKDFPIATHPQQWYCAVYWVITTSTTTGYGDITPKGVAEQVVANSYMILGLVIFGLLVGTISNVTTRASNEAHRLYKFRKKIHRVTQWLHTHRLPQGTQTQIKTYFSHLWAARNEVSLDAEIFSDLPHHMRHGLARHVMLPEVSALRLFKPQDGEMKALVAQYMRPVDIAPGSDLCQQGEEGDRLWILVEGEVDALQHLQPPIRLIAQHDRPCLLGDGLILADDLPASRARTFTIRTIDTCVCKIWELRVANLWSIMRMYPNLVTDMMDHARNRTLVDIATYGREQSEGAHRHSTSSPDFSSWCEMSASISRALVRQSQEFVDLATEELMKARIEDGSLPHLLDLLLDFSMTHSRKQIDMSAAANAAFFAKQPPKPPADGPNGGAASTGPTSRGGKSVTSDGASQATNGMAGDRVRAALGLQSSKAAQWRPGRLGRQTLFRLSSLAAPSRGLASSSIPVQEFGVGYTNFG